MNHLRIIQFLTYILDNRFKIGKFRFGLDPLLGLIPGIGDALSFIISAYIIWLAHTINVSQEKRNIMIKNVVVDFLLGLVPFVGDVGDFIYRANSKNLKILEEHYVNNKA